jgi:phage-related protein
VRDFIEELTDEETAEVVAGMKEVANDGLPAARHLRGEIYEVRIDAHSRAFRVLFACEGKFNHVLLSLVAFAKKTQKTPQKHIELAEGRLRDWRERGSIRHKKPK